MINHGMVMESHTAQVPTQLPRTDFLSIGSSRTSQPNMFQITGSCRERLLYHSPSPLDGPTQYIMAKRIIMLASHTQSLFHSQPLSSIPSCLDLGSGHNLLCPTLLPASSEMPRKTPAKPPHQPPTFQTFPNCTECKPQSRETFLSLFKRV